MSNIEKMIDELCPDGVEYVELGKVLEYEQPTKYIVKNTKYNEEYKIPVLTAGQSFILGYTNEEENIFYASKNKSVIIFDDFTTSFHWVNFPFKVKSSAMKLVKNIDENISNFKYIYYAMKCLNYEVAEHKRHWIGIYSKIKIPLPPLPIQEEIVRILDAFTELTTNLTAELTAELTTRKKQYEYYREKLLSFGEDVEMVELKNIADISTGSSNTNEGLEKGKYPFFVRSQTIKWKNEFEYDEIAIITSGDGVGVGKIIHYIEGKYALHQRAYRIHINTHKVMPKYYYYYMKNSFLDYINKSALSSSVTSIRRHMLDNFKIPLPPLETQQKIVDILDRFDALCNDISKGIPVEIEARQKQYEYYRDKLLSFKEKS